MNKVAILLGIILLTSGPVFAQQSIPQIQQAPVEVGNKTCPVSGRTIGEMGPPYKEQYKGKIYNLCCGGCIGRFESDPERYSKIAEDEAKGQS